jgi:hypothetical protein
MGEMGSAPQVTRWIPAAALVGLASSYVLSDLLRFPRGWFVVGHAVLVGALCLGYVWWERLGIRTQLARRRLAGAVGGILIGAFLARQVLRQPAAPRAQDGELIGQLALYGAVYGVVDALLLSVLPVLVIYGSRPADELRSGGARLRWALAALLGSALITAAYHAGFAEFRGPELVQPIIGNTLITLAYLLTGSLWAPITAHVMMHGAAVLHGMAFTMQLPPHYP